MDCKDKEDVMSTTNKEFLIRQLNSLKDDDFVFEDKKERRKNG